MAKPRTRIAALQAVLAAGGLALLARAGYLQLIRGGDYARRATAQRTVRKHLEAPRGTIYDRAGSPLAASLERYRLEIAPEQVKDHEALIRTYRADIGGRLNRLRRSLARGDYYYGHGPFTATQVRRLRASRGVLLRPLYRREYPSGPLARPLIGALSPDTSIGASGLERFLDSVLAGVPGEAVLLKDGRGRLFESPGRVVRDPIPGHDVVLTIDKELQEIAEGALGDAFEEFRPRRGDIVFLDPRTGEVLAAASREINPNGREVASASYFVSSFEPGSTAKPFTAAGLLELGRVAPEEVVSGEHGVWMMPAAGGKPRKIEDDHAQEGPITLARAIQVSSNIGVVKFSRKLTPVEHYDVLRGFGFGSPTGVEFTAEAAGVLPLPHRWKEGWEGASAAMGYAIQVTPIQLAAAYATLANDGLLLAPAVVKEIKSRDGTVLYRHAPTVVRRVISREVAARIRGFLTLAATDSGTGSRAQVRGGVLGKTGTARLVMNRRYTNRHAASFAGIFPARDPQLVVAVRIEDPKGSYYGGLVAAPLVSRMLRQALASRRTALNRARLADDDVVRTRRFAPIDREAGPPTSSVSFPLSRSPAAVARSEVIPDVVGQSVRAAALSLHRHGFRVRLEGRGWVNATDPAAGDSLLTGKTVTVIATAERRRS